MLRAVKPHMVLATKISKVYLGGYAAMSEHYFAHQNEKKLEPNAIIYAA